MGMKRATRELCASLISSSRKVERGSTFHFESQKELQEFVDCRDWWLTHDWKKCKGKTVVISSSPYHESCVIHSDSPFHLLF